MGINGAGGPIAGTTRDLLCGNRRHQGWLCDIIDSAGLRELADTDDAQDQIERAGQELARQARASVDAVITMVPVDDPDSQRLVQPGDIAGKADLQPADAEQSYVHSIAWSAAPFVANESPNRPCRLAVAVGEARFADYAEAHGHT